MLYYELKKNGILVLGYSSQISQDITVRYLGLRIVRRLGWSYHMKTKSLTLTARLKLLYCLINSNSCASLGQKLAT